MIMKRLFLLTAAMLGLALLPSQAAELKVGDEAPAVKLPGSDGKTYDFSELKDKKVVVVAWFPKALTGG